MGVDIVAERGTEWGVEEATSPRAWLSWDREKVVRRVAEPRAEWVVSPAADAGDSAKVHDHRLRATLYLNVAVAEPLDSLGMHLRWLAAETEGRVTMLGVVTDGWEESGTPREPDSVAADGFRLLLPTWLSRAGLLRDVAARGPQGEWRYCLPLTIEISGGRSFRFAAGGLVVRTVDGEIMNLGEPQASVGEGWMLRFPPLLTEISGRLNKRFIASTLTLRGLELDRLVGLVLIDHRGDRLFPAGVTLLSPRRVEFAFGNGRAASGLCDIEYAGPDGCTQRLTGVVQAAFLSERLPGDTNRGAKPGRQD
jgi:hypothetical protein